MSIGSSQLVEGHLYSGHGWSYRLVCRIDYRMDGYDVYYRYCYSVINQGGLEFGVMRMCRKPSFLQWAKEEVHRGEGFDQKDINKILAVHDSLMIGSSRGEVKPSPHAIALKEAADEFAESIRAETKDEIESYRSLLREILADQETMKEPYRNEALCEKIRAAIKEGV